MPSFPSIPIPTRLTLRYQQTVLGDYRVAASATKRPTATTLSHTICLGRLPRREERRRCRPRYNGAGKLCGSTFSPGKGSRRPSV